MVGRAGAMVRRDAVGLDGTALITVRELRRGYGGSGARFRGGRGVTFGRRGELFASLV